VHIDASQTINYCQKDTIHKESRQFGFGKRLLSISSTVNGTLVNNKLLAVDEFLKVYWNTIISTYEVLSYTNDKRDLYVDFKFLYTEAHIC
jgi:hypothetical protein